MSDLPEGVSWHPGIQMWRADATFGKKHIYLGSRFTIAEAAALYESEAPGKLAEYQKKVDKDKVNEQSPSQ